MSFLFDEICYIFHKGVFLNGGVVYGNASERILLRHFGIHFGRLDGLFPKRGVWSNQSLKGTYMRFWKKKFFY